MQWFCVANKKWSSEPHEDSFNLHSATDSNPRRIWAWSVEISSIKEPSHAKTTITVHSPSRKKNKRHKMSLKMAPFLPSRWLQNKFKMCKIHKSCLNVLYTCLWLLQCELKQTHPKSNKYSKLWLVLRVNMSLIGSGISSSSTLKTDSMQLQTRQILLD